MNSVLVFCGSNFGKHPDYAKHTHDLGVHIARRGIKLIYGGANIGLMGAVADAALSEKGHVIGILPKFLQEKEIAHDHLSELIFVESLHERKALMAKMSDASIALPGGLGTLEELCEFMTHSQLGLYKKPIGVLNINGFFDSFIQQLNFCVKEGFIQAEQKERLLVSSNVNDLLDQLADYQWKPIAKTWNT